MIGNKVKKPDNLWLSEGGLVTTVDVIAPSDGLSGERIFSGEFWTAINERTLFDYEGRMHHLTFHEYKWLLQQKERISPLELRSDRSLLEIYKDLLTGICSGKLEVLRFEFPGEIRAVCFGVGFLWVLSHFLMGRDIEQGLFFASAGLSGIVIALFLACFPQKNGTGLFHLKNPDD